MCGGWRNMYRQTDAPLKKHNTFILQLFTC